MIRRVTANNYMSLVAFEWCPEPATLVLGANGSGKTSALSIIDGLRLFILGQVAARHLVSPEARTAWLLALPHMSFGLDLDAEGRRFEYRLDLSVPNDGSVSVDSESLLCDGIMIFGRVLSSSSFGEYNLGSDQIPPLSRQNSVVSLVEVTDLKSPLGIFRNAIEGILYVRPLSPQWDDESRAPVSYLNEKMSNAVSWYRHLKNHYLGFEQILDEMLSEVWNGFRGLNLRHVGETARLLELKFESQAPLRKEMAISFFQASDGERSLVGLYMLAAYQKVSPPTTIMIDEPDNFVGIPELQPWLLRMLEDRPKDGQIIVVSHNPEIIGTMGEDRVAFFDRPSHSEPTRVLKIQPDETGLSLSERMARGWLGG